MCNIEQVIKSLIMVFRLLAHVAMLQRDVSLLDGLWSVLAADGRGYWASSCEGEMLVVSFFFFAAISPRVLGLLY